MVLSRPICAESRGHAVTGGGIEAYGEYTEAGEDTVLLCEAMWFAAGLWLTAGPPSSAVWVFSSSGALCPIRWRRLERTHRLTRMIRPARAITPPTVPPAMAPTLGLSEFVSTAVKFAVDVAGICRVAVRDLVSKRPLKYSETDGVAQPCTCVVFVA
jgi:hypothetical protein